MIKTQLDIENLRSSIGFSLRDLKNLCEIADQHTLKAGKPGFIRARGSGVVPQSLDQYPAGIGIAAIDFGGTGVKAVVLETTGNGLELIEIKTNKVSSAHTPANTFPHSLSNFAYAVAMGLDLNDEDKKEVKVLSIGYSQDGSRETFNKDWTSGMTTIVPKGFKGGVKNEAFMRSIQPGDNIAQLTLDAFKIAGFTNIKTVSVDNDAIATACVPPPKVTFKKPQLSTKVGGVIASTGANATIYIDDKQGGAKLAELANSEAGSQFKIPSGFLPEYLKAGFAKADIKEVSLERLTGRINLVDQFFIECDHAITKREDAPFLKSLNAEDRAKILQNKKAPELIEKILKGDVSGIVELLKELGVSTNVELRTAELQALQAISSGIGLRSAQMCALLCYISAGRCLDDSNFIANLDASMNGIFPDFAKNVQNFVDKILSQHPRNGQIHINHMPPSGNLSIPIKGGVAIVMQSHIQKAA